MNNAWEREMVCRRKAFRKLVTILCPASRILIVARAGTMSDYRSHDGTGENCSSKKSIIARTFGATIRPLG